MDKLNLSRMEKSLWDWIVSFAVACILPIINPIWGMLVALLISFVASGLVGWRADVKQGGKFKGEKAFKVFTRFAIIASGMFVSASICKLMDNVEEGVWIMKTIAWMAIGLNGFNIVRNLKIIYPDWEFIKILAWVFEFKFLRKNEYLKDYYEKNEQQGDRAHSEA